MGSSGGSTALGELGFDPATQVELDAAIAAETAARTALASQVPSLEELAVINGMTYVGIAASASFPVFIALFGCSIEQAAIVPHLAGVAASNTDYWVVQFRRWRAGVSAIIATKTTQLTGEALTSRVSWNFNNVVFDPANKVLMPGDAVDIAMTKLGAPAAMPVVGYTLRYVPT
jgi:hypothetical protein